MVDLCTDFYEEIRGLWCHGLPQQLFLTLTTGYLFHTFDETCAITLNYGKYTNHVGVSPRALYCVVDTSYGLGRSLGDCRPALPKG